MIDGISRLFPERAAVDALDQVCRVHLCGEEYVLPMLPAGPNARWREKLDASLRALLDDVQAETADIMATIARISGLIPAALDLLEEYDRDHLLPARERILETDTEVTIMRAVLEVWAAANPLAAIAVMTALGETMDALRMSVSSPDTSTSVEPTPAGEPLASSGNGSPTSSSSGSSTLLRIGKNGTPKPRSSRRSKPSGSAPSSRPTARPSTAGALDPPVRVAPADSARSAASS